MPVEIISSKENKLTLQVQIDLSGSMLEMEERILAACNEIGALSTEKALDRFDTDGTPIMIGEKKIHSKNEGK